MSNKKFRNRKQGITDKIFQREIRNYSGLKCGDDCPFVELIDKAVEVMVKVRGGIYENIQELLLPVNIALPTNTEHQENIETSYQQLVHSRFQSIGLSCSVPTSNVLEDYGLHITNKL